MNHIRFQFLSAAFIALTLSAGCTMDAGFGEYDDPAAVAPQAAGSSEGSSELVGHLAAGQIQTVVRAEFPQFQTCYEGLLADNAGAAGQIALKFTINPDGTMAETSVGSADGALVDANFQQCMLSATGTLVFPEAADQTDVVYPILMTPGDDS